MTNAVVGVDVGGTFTDLVLMDQDTGEVRIAKVPTTPENQAFGVLNAVAAAGIALKEVASISHGTTTTTNAILERKIARCGLITTRGFRDVLELGRRTRPNPYGLLGHFEPLIPRELRYEVSERMDAAGNVLVPLDEDAVRHAAEALVAAGCEALVIHFLHSYRNSAHERRAAEVAAEVWPNHYITAGHAVLSEYREYERGVTATVNAAVQPVLHRYIARLETELAAQGYEHDLLVMQGNGGSVSARIVADTAVNTVMSGPASGVMAAAATARAAGVERLITFDTGGTSCDVGLVIGGVPEVTAEMELEYAMPVHVPMVDVHTIGAGGGSVALLNAAGMLQVGPESAGARPGPICYGHGGTKPTLTDANLVLGRLDPGGLLSVDNPVSMEKIKGILVSEVGAGLSLNAEETAAAILAIGNDRMAGAIRMVTLSRGHDPRDFTLFAFGGAGPMHAVALARELGVPRVMVPARPGITNAVGCIAADLRHDYVNTVNAPLADLDVDEVHAIFARHVADGKATIAREGVATERVDALHFAEMQFQGQTHLMTIPLDGPNVTQAQLAEVFARVYFDRFQVELPEIRPVLVNLHTAVIGRRPPVPLGTLVARAPGEGSGRRSQLARRSIWFAQGGWQETPIYERSGLHAETAIDGPAIVTQLDSTTVIEPDCRARLDVLGNLIIEVGA
jgi:N-methylhydantoinase A